MKKVESIKELKKISFELRKKVLEMTFAAGCGHPGGPLGEADVFTALFFNKMNLNPLNPKDDLRDRFILSNGHCAPILYACLAKQGFFPEKELMNLRKMGSFLAGHPERTLCKGIETTTGALGQGLSVGNGMALAAKLDKKKHKIFVHLSDGEIQEGQSWEAAMLAGFYKLNNVIAFIDVNGIQIDGYSKNVMDPAPVADKFKAFNWNAMEINGNNFEEIFNALEAAYKSDKPFAVVYKSVLGKGVSFMENVPEFHGRALTKEEMEKALPELNKSINELSK